MYKACISIDDRDIVRKQTLLQFNLEFKIYKNSKPLGLINHSENVLNVLNDFIKSKEDELLFIEDDLIVSNRFNTILGKCVHSNFDIITLYAPKSLVRKELRNKEGLLKVKRSGFFGSQCLLLKKDFVSHLLKVWNNQYYFDQNIESLCKNRKIPIYTYLPNPINHKGLKSTWSRYGNGHKSCNFK